VLGRLLDDAPEVLLLVDGAGETILGARGAVQDLLERTPASLAGQPLAILRPRQPPPRVIPLGPSLLEQPGQWAEVSVAGPDGAFRICAVWVAPRLEGGRGPILLRLADVTERFMLQRSLEEVQRQARALENDRNRERQANLELRRAGSLSIFAAGLSHELNNPLSAALANFSAAQSICRDVADTPGPELVEEMHQLMRDAALSLRRMEALVRRLRELEYAPRIQEMDAAEWLRQHADSDSFHLDAPQRLPVKSDPILLERLLNPLLDNARLASNGAPGIRVSLQAAGEEFRLSVADRGPGIPPDLAERVFDPFFTTRPPGQGLGMGLFLARHAAQQLGGNLSLEPRDGGGCVAVARLPMDSTPFGNKAGPAQYESFRTSSR
jgi:signal transduction histidine kinase